jgi:hypothetical protein
MHVYTRVSIWFETEHWSRLHHVSWLAFHKNQLSHDTSLKYIWTFSAVLIFTHVYNILKVTTLFFSVRDEMLYVWIKNKN